MELNDNTGVTIPVRNLIGMIAFTAVATTAYFGIQERLNVLEHALDKTQKAKADSYRYSSYQTIYKLH